MNGQMVVGNRQANSKKKFFFTELVKGIWNKEEITLNVTLLDEVISAHVFTGVPFVVNVKSELIKNIYSIVA